MFLAFIINEDSNLFPYGICALRTDALQSIQPLEGKGYHDLNRLEVLYDFPEVITCSDTLAFACQRLEVPTFLLIQRISIRATAEEHPVHLIQVVLQAIVVLREHSGAECDLQHMPFEGDRITDTHATSRLKDLRVGILPIYLNDFTHQGYSCDGDVADFILRHRTIGFDGDEVTDDTLYDTFCCHYIVLFLFIYMYSG